ncbi:MAG: DUF5990 family protein [Pseudomonadota bacterium]
MTLFTIISTVNPFSAAPTPVLERHSKIKPHYISATRSAYQLALSVKFQLDCMKQLLRLRIVVTEPVPGLHFALQRGKSELVAPTSREPELIFDFTVHAELLNDPLRLTGEFTQGPPAARFIYINSGSYAGQPGTIWSRRAKVPISGIKAQMATDAIASNCVLQAVVCGVAKDGGPFCASIPLLKDWMVVSAS